MYKTRLDHCHQTQELYPANGNFESAQKLAMKENFTENPWYDPQDHTGYFSKGSVSVAGHDKHGPVYYHLLMRKKHAAFGQNLYNYKLQEL